jgi:hypothetical protein
MWHRVFGLSPSPVEPADLLRHLRDGLGLPAEGHFRGDDAGWFACDLALPEASPVRLERFLTEEDGLRDELNTWAAWLETADYTVNSGPLMEKVIGTRQLFTLRRPVDHADEARLDRLCLGVCRYLAARTDGFYQVDGQGFFAADGQLLVQEY